MKSHLILCSFIGIFFSTSLAQEKPEKETLITLFLCGDVMLGRGIDQILPFPSDPVIHESYLKDARGYLELAEQTNGPISYPVPFSYIWGDALDELERVSPDVRLINLETSITKSKDYWKDKGINYRMNPKNIGCLTAAQIDFCSLANNHVLDWGYSGLTETLETLKKADIRYAGAGENTKEAETPVVMNVKEKGRVIIFSCGMPSSGIPFNWLATEEDPGINLLENLSDKTVQHIKEKIEQQKGERDIVVVSIHWGQNWSYDIPFQHMEFAHKLIDQAGADIIYGHSSHHAKGIEVYKNRPIIYGCGDFLNDYEGIGGREEFRGDLGLMYFIKMDPDSGNLLDFQMTPTQIKLFKINRASRSEAHWLRDVLNREGKKFGTWVTIDENHRLILHWE